MDILLLLARLLHILLGAFWAGTLIFTALFLTPALGDVGPDGAKVMGALARRRFMTVMPIVALVTLLSGFWLYWRLSGGFAAGFMGSRQGQMLGAGAVAALVAWVIGLAVVRPAMMRLGAIGQRAAQLSGAERDAVLAQAQAVRTRSAVASRWVAGLLTLALAAMAVARYV
jgi:uncharacterized membrane protein